MKKSYNLTFGHDLNHINIVVTFLTLIHIKVEQTLELKHIQQLGQIELLH